MKSLLVFFLLIAGIISWVFIALHTKAILAVVAIMVLTMGCLYLYIRGATR